MIKNRMVLVLFSFSLMANQIEEPSKSDLSSMNWAMRDEFELDERVLSLAVKAYKNARNKQITTSSILCIIDYSRKSARPRFWVLDLAKHEVLFFEHVAHGANSGDRSLAKRFSNDMSSKQTSLGLFLTGPTYFGKNGYSLQLIGLENGVNDNAYKRRIVLHGANYVSREMASQLGFVGRSFGCPSVSTAVSKPIIDTIKDGTLLFSYYPDADWLNNSEFLKGS